MTRHIADRTAPRPRPHHYMNADGTCHAGDLMEAGTPFVALYDAEELVRIVNAEKAEAWDEGHKQGGPMCDVNYDDPDAHNRNPYRSHVEGN